jgi:hypothetical protein
MLAALLANRRKWTQKRDLRLPITGPVFQDMQDIVARPRHKNNPPPHTNKASALFDWIGLSVFTCHRLSEFRQSTLPAGSTAQGFDPLPKNSHIPPACRGKPKAFVRDDFSLYDARLHQLDHDQLRVAPSSAEALGIVKRATSIVLRALQLRLPIVDAPLGVFICNNGQRYTISSPHIAAFLQEACTLAYPDPRHYYRLNIHLFQAHSIRISACVDLDNAEVPHDEIAFRLRLSSDAMKGYLRNCPRHIGDLTASAIIGINAHTDTTLHDVPAPGSFTNDRS